MRAYTRNTSKSAAREQNKSAVTDHAIFLNHVVDWDRAKVIDRESNRMDPVSYTHLTLPTNREV